MRLIDADALTVELMDSDLDHLQRDDWKEVFQIVADAPTIEGHKWIPCSERLPEYGVSVLTYDGNCFCVEKRIPIIKDEAGEAISSDWWVSDDYDESCYDYYPNLRDGACIAWMPLPEPYKGGQMNENQI